METTCGSFALKGLHAKQDAGVVKQLVQAGFIIIAKANLSVNAPKWSVVPSLIFPGIWQL